MYAWCKLQVKSAILADHVYHVRAVGLHIQQKLAYFLFRTVPLAKLQSTGKNTPLAHLPITMDTSTAPVRCFPAIYIRYLVMTGGYHNVTQPWPAWDGDIFKAAHPCTTATIICNINGSIRQRQHPGGRWYQHALLGISKITTNNSLSYINSIQSFKYPSKINTLREFPCQMCH